MSKVDEAERRVDKIDAANVLKFYKLCWLIGQVLGHLLPPIIASVLLTLAFERPWYTAVGIFCAILSVMPVRKVDPFPKGLP